MSLFVPVAPSISSITSTSFVVSVLPDGNPSGTYYSFRIVTGSIIKYADAFGNLHDTVQWVNSTALSVLGLTPNSSYAVYLAAASDSLGTGATVEGPGTTAPTLAALPLAMPYQNVFSSTLMAVWGANSNPTGTQYYAEISPDSSFTFNVSASGWTTSTAFIFTALLPGTTYYGRVKAKNIAVVETAWVSLLFTVTPVGPDTVKAIHVTNLLVERGFLIQWLPNLETNIVNYRVYRSSSPTDDSGFLLIGTTPANVTSWIDKVPFTFGIVWYYKITALDNGNNESAITLTSPVQDNTYHTFEEQPFPTTVNLADYVTDEIPAGLINGINMLFTASFPYKKHTLEVYLGGAKQIRGLDFNEGPLSQQFTMLDAPDLGDYLYVSYIRF
jgi:hypothetical protein